MNLVAMVPSNNLASTQYCLSNPGFEYLVYLPCGGGVKVDLEDARGRLKVEWFDPNTGDNVRGKDEVGGDIKEFSSPFDKDAVLYIRAY
ncbi:MAG: putative collagen-binding domain-containing protein [Thermoproteota archaeon]